MKNVHTEHCCLYHGCQYGEEDCPVANAQQKQSFPCESCDGGTISIYNAGDYFIGKGEVSKSLETLYQHLKKNYPERAFEIYDASTEVITFWNQAIKDGTAKFIEV